MPYLSLTIGATLLEPDSGGYDSETRFSGSIGAASAFRSTTTSRSTSCAWLPDAARFRFEPVLRQRFRGGWLPPAVVGQHVLPG